MIKKFEVIWEVVEFFLSIDLFLPAGKNIDEI
jgi:hypothetical protein